jgi:hypothetical protein
VESNEKRRSWVGWLVVHKRNAELKIGETRRPASYIDANVEWISTMRITDAPPTDHDDRDTQPGLCETRVPICWARDP